MIVSKTPQVSVVMPVHNALPYLDAAVESILGQTFCDFEFVILDDASTDGSTQRLRMWAERDHRIRLLEERHNLGPAGSSERVARAASAPIVARMDADDISYPTRLAEQLEILNRFPEVGVVGGLCDMIDVAGRRTRRAELWRLVQHGSVPPFGNGPMMYRREVFESVGGYRKECDLWEDHDLLLRMSAVTKIMVVPHAIYQIRQSPVSTRYASEQHRLERALDLMFRCRTRLDEDRPYEDLLHSATTEGAKLHPRVFISMGSILLWTGGHPRLFKRLISHGKLGANFTSLTALVWTAWASIEPRSLRAFIRSILFFRNRYASVVVPTNGPVLWPGTTALRASPVPFRSAPHAELAKAQTDPPVGGPAVASAGRGTSQNRR
ncbi:MAG TPA: glycosyltransferase family A protein [Dehalococcoidia bacterium]|nr:glycosyltransferase family A protein [Dehalococcoidia bacterium]